MFSQNVNFNSGKISGNLIQSKVNNVQNNNDNSGIILYLYYPNYINHSKNTFSGIVGNLWDKSHVDTKAAEKYILKLANDRTRKKYSETNTCATLASDVAIKFQAPNYKQGNFINGIYEIFNNNDAYNIISDVMTLIPYTSHNYNAEIRNRGDETFYFDE